MDDSVVVRSVLAAHSESEDHKEVRMRMNRQNFHSYHLREDYSHKREGQSREFLAKQSMAVEQLTSFLSQGLIDVGNWFSLSKEDGVPEDPLLSEDTIYKLLERQMKKNNEVDFVSDGVKLGALGALIICKIHGKDVSSDDFEVETDDLTGDEKLIKTEKKNWQLKLDLIRQEDYFPDPTGDGLYEIQRIEMDWHNLVEIAKKNPSEFDMEAVMNLQSNVDTEQENKKREETAQGYGIPEKYRKRVEILEYWGDIIDPATGEVVHKNICCSIANGRQLIRKPKPNPFWHGKSPFVVAPIIRVPHSVWHKALMDAPTAHNHALNEIYNLMLDAGIMSTFGIKQLRESWLDDPSQVNNGVVPGTTLTVNSACPPGHKVLERIDTSALSNDAITMFNLTEKEFQQSALTNDLRMGVMPERNVKATEIVAQNQALTGMFQGIVKQIESAFISKVLDLSWKVIAQNMDDLRSSEVKAVLGEEKAMALSTMSSAEIFARSVQGNKFRVFGLSSVLNKVQDFRKVTSLLQTISASPILATEFQRDYSFTKLLREVIKSLDIDEAKIKKDQADIMAQQQQNQQVSELTQALNPNQQAQEGQPPEDQNQIPSSFSDEQSFGVQRGSVERSLTNPS